MSAPLTLAFTPDTRHPYLASAWLALRVRAGERAQLYARAALYVLILFAFSRVWRAVLGDPSGRIWYLALAEWIAVSQPRLFLELERDVRSGEVASALTRPSSYLWMKLSESAGELVLGLVSLAPVGFVAAFVFGGRLPADLRGLLPAVVLALLASAVCLLCSALIGVSAFWLREVSPLHWVWQKASFLLGGLMIPLELYPAWLRTLALWSPFSAIFYLPARTLAAFNPQLALLCGVKLVAMIVLLHAFLEFSYGRALRKLALEGD